MTALISPGDVRLDSWETFPKALIYTLYVSFSVVSHSLRPYGLWPTRHLCRWNSPGKNTEVGSHSLHRGNLPNPGIKPGSPALQAGSLLSEPPGKPWAIREAPKALEANPNFSLLRLVQYICPGSSPPTDTRILSTERGEHFRATDRVS